MTHKEIILRHIREYGDISAMEAFNLYNITALHSRISDLRNLDGYKNIETFRKPYTTSDGKTRTHPAYRFRDE